MSDKNKKVFWLLTAFLILTGVIAGLLFRLGIHISKDLPDASYPKGAVQELILQAPAVEGHKDFMEITCPTYPYKVLMPIDTVEKNNIFFGKNDGITFLMMETNASFDELMGHFLPKEICHPVLGKEPDYEKEFSKDGYLYGQKASYQMGTVETKISVRKIKTYTCGYLLDLGEGRNIVFYASTEEKAQFLKAEQFIRQMAMSTTYYKKGIEPEGAGNGTETEEVEYPRSFAMDVKNDYFLSTGICVFHWTNVSIVPEEIVLLKDGREMARLEKNYSIPGEYVFILGTVSPGTYQICGAVNMPLKNVWVNFQELEDYKKYLESQEDTALFIPRDPD